MGKKTTVERSEFLSALQQYEGKTETHDIPELGVTFKLRALSKRDQMEIRKAAAGPDGQLADPEAMEAHLFLAGVVEPKLEDEDLELLFSVDAGIFDRIVAHITQLSGLVMDQEELERRFPGLTESAT